MLENLNKIFVSVLTAIILAGLSAMVNLYQKVTIVEINQKHGDKHIENVLDGLVTKDQNELDKLKLRNEIMKSCR